MDGRFEFETALTLLARNDAEEAERWATRAVALNGANPQFRCALGAARYQQKCWAEAAEDFREATRIDPKCADAWSNLAASEHQQKCYAEAREAYQRCLALDPRNWSALTNFADHLCDCNEPRRALELVPLILSLSATAPDGWIAKGNALRLLEDFVAAEPAYRQALALAPNHWPSMSNLGVCLYQQGKLTEAAQWLQHALQMRPGDSVILSNLGNVFFEQGKFDAAGELYEKSLERSPDYASAHLNQSNLFLLRGDFARGWAEYEWRWKTGRIAPRISERPQWAGEPLAGRTILIDAEQGFGDTLQFIRFVELLKERGATVVLECPKSLQPLLASCSEIDSLSAAPEQPLAYDFHSPLLSLPRIFQTSLSSIPGRVPYLFADKKLIAKWGESLNGQLGDWQADRFLAGKRSGKGNSQFRVGINWRGRIGQGEFRKRDIPLELFLTLGAAPGAQLVRLQKDIGEDELEICRRSHVFDPGERFDAAGGAFMDTAALMMNLDLVITSDTAVAHLAGALGVPVWLALPFVPDWRWLLHRSDSPWYPTMRLFRQTSPGDWAGVFGRISKELEAHRPHGTRQIP